MFYFTTGSGATCFVGFIGVVWLAMVIGAIARAMRGRGQTLDTEAALICSDPNCASHNPPYARFCHRCGANLDRDVRRIKQALNEDRR